MGGTQPNSQGKDSSCSSRFRTRCLRTRVIAAAVAPALASEPVEGLKKNVQEAVRRFQSEPVTPQRFLELENELKAAADDACREVLEREANRLEPEDKGALPGKVRY